jgi:hypothetical protein
VAARMICSCSKLLLGT